MWLYLARRDRTSVRLLASFPGAEQPAVRVNDLATLGLPGPARDFVGRAVSDDKMYWELWAESAPSYQALQKSLRSRGYSNVPMSGQPEYLKPIGIRPVKLSRPKTMLRRRTR